MGADRRRRAASGRPAAGAARRARASAATSRSTCRRAAAASASSRSASSCARATDWAPAGHEVAWQQSRCRLGRERPRAARGAGHARGRRRRRARADGVRAAVDLDAGVACCGARARTGATSSSTARGCSSGARRPTTTACRWCPSTTERRPAALARARSRPAGAQTREHRRAARIASRSCIEPPGGDAGTTSRTVSATGCSPTGELAGRERRRARARPPRRAARSGSVLTAPARPRAARVVRPRAVGGILRDRLASTVVGRFASTVTDQYVPYILPQEHGHHERHALAHARPTDAGFGLEVRGRPTIGFAASHFTAADLYGARHTNELEPRPEVLLSLDHAQRGLGTASCGPDTASAVPAARTRVPVHVRAACHSMSHWRTPQSSRI